MNVAREPFLRLAAALANFTQALDSLQPPVDYQVAVTMLRAISTTPTVPLGDLYETTFDWTSPAVPEPAGEDVSAEDFASWQRDVHLPEFLPGTAARLVLAADPTANLHASTKQYVDNQIASTVNGTDWKDSVVVATTGATGQAHAAEGGYRISGPGTAPMFQAWQGPWQVEDASELSLSPEPVGAPLSLVLSGPDTPERIRVATDGLRPFALQRLPARGP